MHSIILLFFYKHFFIFFHIFFYLIIFIKNVMGFNRTNSFTKLVFGVLNIPPSSHN